MDLDEAFVAIDFAYDTVTFELVEAVMEMLGDINPPPNKSPWGSY